MASTQILPFAAGFAPPIDEGQPSDRSPTPGLGVERGHLCPAGAPIAVVVMAIDGDPRIADAVASLQDQARPVEIVVVNSGTGSVKPWLTTYLPLLVLVEGKQRRLPGGTRNLGIAYSTAPIVAFLAADCIATPGWVEHRLAAHGHGALAVASALRPAPEGGKVTASAWASYALLHARRTPEYPAAGTARYGASYARMVFERHGRFREDLRVGEDTEFNERIAVEAQPAWAPQVVTMHRYPPTMRAALGDAAQRGRNLFIWNRGRSRHPLLISLRRVVGNLQMTRRLHRHADAPLRKELRRAAPRIALLALAYGGGILMAWSGR
jgi:hypothetical protein